ncbi:MAG: PorV/PorQ family protein [Elusimicrobia bacterium]|nr:PorV/PorQ family protein [Elusimicrobiota bacterium]
MNAFTALSAAFLLAAAAVAAHAGAAAGAESFDFLLFDPSARAAGLGGAYTALASDANALFYNPAGLGRIKAHEVTFMHNRYVEGLTQEYAGLATRQGWGLNVNRLDFGGISRTRVESPDGGLGSAGLTDMALSGGYGRALSESLSVGAGAKFIRETLDGVSAGGFAVDAGVLAAVSSLPGLTLGAALLNAGPGVRFQSRRESLPLLGRAGAAFSFRTNKTENTAAFDATKARTDTVRVGIGVETIFEKLLALRLGFSDRGDAGLGLACGVGFLWKALAVDFAFVPFGDLGSVNRLSLTFRWGNEAKRDSPRAERRSSPADPEAPPTQRKEAAPAPSGNEKLRLVLDNEKRGRNALNGCDCAKAKSFFAEAIAAASAGGLKDPVVADAYAGMGRCLLEDGKIDDASKFFKAFVEGPSPETERLVREEREILRLR